MKKTAFFLLLILGVQFFPSQKAQAQTVQILANNTLNGAINGVVLGSAGMLIADKKVNAPFTKNMDDLYAIQVGLGVGMLYGVGVGAYDLASSGGQQMLVSGFFNDATNTTAILLMDTFYGAAAGTVISASITLLSSDPNLTDVKTGLGIGTYVGFTFGIFDGFFLADRSSAPISYSKTLPQAAQGFASIQFSNSTSIGVINPSISSFLEVDNGSLSQSVTPTIEFMNIRVNF